LEHSLLKGLLAVAVLYWLYLVFTQAVYQRDFAERYDRQVNSRESVVTSQFQKFQDGRISIEITSLSEISYPNRLCGIYTGDKTLHIVAIASSGDLKRWEKFGVTTTDHRHLKSQTQYRSVRRQTQYRSVVTTPKVPKASK